jgi:hypothetical protein
LGRVESVIVQMITAAKESGRKCGDVDGEREINFGDRAPPGTVYGTTGFSVKGVRA